MGLFPAKPPLWLRVVLFALAFWGSAYLSQLLSVSPNSYVTFWLPAGLYAGILLREETRNWRWFLLGAFGANLAFDLPHGSTLPTFFGFYLANTTHA
ncbi:MAG TPA: hypothetical protein VF607_12600, partial [Verrucomicrobiae bacterium]